MTSQSVRVFLCLFSARELMTLYSASFTWKIIAFKRMHRTIGKTYQVFLSTYCHSDIIGTVLWYSLSFIYYSVWNILSFFHLFVSTSHPNFKIHLEYKLCWVYFSSSFPDKPVSSQTDHYPKDKTKIAVLSRALHTMKANLFLMTPSSKALLNIFILCEHYRLLSLLKTFLFHKNIKGGHLNWN
jgi:hypothetical protein